VTSDPADHRSPTVKVLDVAALVRDVASQPSRAVQSK
jgi:hypothetical protein